MKKFNETLVRAVVYSFALVYLFLDLFVLKGPLYQRVKESNPRSERVIAEETARGVAARVYFQPILLTQIDRAVEKKLWHRGKSPQTLSPEELKSRRLAVLDDLFRQHLLRVKVRFNANEIEVTEQEVAAAVRTYRKRFANEKLLTEAMKNQGWEGEAELIARVRAKLEQEAYLEKYIETEVSEEELGQFFQEHKARFTLPERRQVRHLFFAALQHPDGEALQLATQTLERLQAGEDFAQLAAELSDDPATKENGGELGWMSRERLSPRLRKGIFTSELNTITIVESEIGVHLIEVLDQRKARERSFEEVQAELRETLSNQKREEGVERYLRVLRHRESNKVEIFMDVLERPWSL